MKYRIALLSAYIGSPGKNELKMTEGCRKRLADYGVDVFLFNNTNIDLLMPYVQPAPEAKPPTLKTDIGFVKNLLDKIRFHQFIYPTEEATRNRLVAKLPKMQFYRLLDKDYDYYIWMDSKFTLLDNWLDVILKWIEQYGQHDLVICKHSERDSIASEYEYMRYYMVKKDDNLCPKYVLKDMYYQVQEYLSDSKYVDNKLYEAGFILYSKNILKHKDFLDSWYAHNYYYTIQDQLSLPYLLQKHNIDVCPLAKSVYKLPGTHYWYYD